MKYEHWVIILTTNGIRLGGPDITLKGREAAHFVCNQDHEKQFVLIAVLLFPVSRISETTKSPLKFSSQMACGKEILPVHSIDFYGLFMPIFWGALINHHTLHSGIYSSGSSVHFLVFFYSQPNRLALTMQGLCVPGESGQRQ